MEREYPRKKKNTERAYEEGKVFSRKMTSWSYFLRKPTRWNLYNPERNEFQDEERFYKGKQELENLERRDIS